MGTPEDKAVCRAEGTDGDTELGFYAGSCLKRLLMGNFDGMPVGGGRVDFRVLRQQKAAFVGETADGGALYRCQTPGCEAEYVMRVAGDVLEVSPKDGSGNEQ